MPSRSPSADDQLLARLRGHPDLREGIQSLAYWRERRQRLSWYRVRARREAARMTVTWEPRVRGALLSQRAVPLDIRVSASLLLARTLLQRWRRRAAVVIAATLAAAFVAAPVIAAVVLLLRVL